MILEVGNVYVIKGNSGTKLAEIISSSGKSVMKLKADTHPAKCMKKINTSKDGFPVVVIIDTGEYKVRGGKGPIVNIDGQDVTQMKKQITEKAEIK